MNDVNAESLFTPLSASEKHRNLIQITAVNIERS